MTDQRPTTTPRAADTDDERDRPPADVERELGVDKEPNTTPPPMADPLEREGADAPDAADIEDPEHQR